MVRKERTKGKTEWTLTGCHRGRLQGETSSNQAER